MRTGPAAPGLITTEKSGKFWISGRCVWPKTITSASGKPSFSTSGSRVFSWSPCVRTNRRSSTSSLATCGRRRFMIALSTLP